MKKVLLISKDVLATKVSFSGLKREREVLQYQLSTLRERFKFELTDKELEAKYHRLNVPITNFSFSTRAQTAFARCNIKTLIDLDTLTLRDLKSIRNIGSLTAKEIVTKALEFGIRID